MFWVVNEFNESKQLLHVVVGFGSLINQINRWKLLFRTLEGAALFLFLNSKSIGRDEDDAKE